MVFRFINQISVKGLASFSDNSFSDLTNEMSFLTWLKVFRRNQISTEGFASCSDLTKLLNKPKEHASISAYLKYFIKAFS